MLRKYVCVQGSQSVLRHCTAALPDIIRGCREVKRGGLPSDMIPCSTSAAWKPRVQSG